MKNSNNNNAQKAIANMRTIIGADRAATQWEILSFNEKKALCVAAELCPNIYANDRLREIPYPESEAIRSALLNLKLSLSKVYATGPEEWHLRSQYRNSKKQSSCKEYINDSL